MKKIWNRNRKLLLAGAGIGLVLVIVLGVWIFYQSDGLPALEVNPSLPEIDIPVSPTSQEEMVSPNELDEAMAINDDVVAWINIPGTYINGPVLQSQDNTYYLRNNLWKQYDQEGSLYADFECGMKPDELSRNLIVYGHNWRNSENKGFSQLHRYLEEDGEFFSEHPNIQLELTDHSVLNYRIVSAGIANVNADGVCITADPDDKQWEQIIALTKERNVLDTDLTLKEDVQMLTLSTCTGNDATRVLVVAVLDSEIE